MPAHTGVLFSRIFTRNKTTNVPSAARAVMGPKVVTGVNMRRSVYPASSRSDTRWATNDPPPPSPTTPYCVCVGGKAGVGVWVRKARAAVLGLESWAVQSVGGKRAPVTT